MTDCCFVCYRTFDTALVTPCDVLDCAHRGQICYACVAKLSDPKCPMCRRDIDLDVVTRVTTKMDEIIRHLRIAAIDRCIRELQRIDCWNVDVGKPQPCADIASDVDYHDGAWTVVGAVGPPSQFVLLANAYTKLVYCLN